MSSCEASDVKFGARWRHDMEMPVAWASCQIRKIPGAHAPGMPGTFSPLPQVSDPDMHHGTCVTHVPWCMSGSLTSGFLWNRRRGKRSRHSRRRRNLQFYVSGKRPITASLWGESIDHQWIPSQRTGNVELRFLCCQPDQETEKKKQSSLRWLETHLRLCNVTLMIKTTFKVSVRELSGYFTEILWSVSIYRYRLTITRILTWQIRLPLFPETWLPLLV